MAKSPLDPQQSPDPDPGAAAPLDPPAADPSAVPQGAAPTPESSATPPNAAPPVTTQRYAVNWRFEGFRENPLVEGDTVDATEDEAAPYVGGVLSLVNPEA